MTHAVLPGKALVLTVCVSCCALLSGAVTVDELKLTNDVTITVADGETLDILRLTGYPYRLTKSGLGTLCIRNVENPGAKITVAEGTLTSAALPCPAVVAQKAFFHVDASVAATLVTESRDGTNYVTRWNDVRGEGHPYATAAVADSTVGLHNPYLSVHPETGLPVLDFGSLYVKNPTVEPSPRGWGATMQWSETCDRPMDGYVVLSDTEDVKAFVSLGGSGTSRRGQAILGNSAGASFLRGNPIEGKDTSPILLDGAFARQVALMSWDVDDLSFASDAALTYCLPNGFHVLGFHAQSQTYVSDASKSVPVNAFARERSNEFGGQRIAESIVFTNLLSEDERNAIKSYLLSKWNSQPFAELRIGTGASVVLPAGRAFVPAVCINEGGAISGEGTVRPALTLDGTSLAATASVTYDPLATADAWLHVDANADSVIGISGAEQYHANEVFCWGDVRGRKPKSGSDKPGDAGRYAWVGNANSKPWLNADYLAQGCGLTVMDFNKIWRSGDGTQDLANHPQSWFEWSEICETPRTFLVVVADDDDAKKGEGTNFQLRDQPFIGNRCRQFLNPDDETPTQGLPIFARTNREADNTPSPYYLNGSAGGKFYCDGTQVAAPLTTAFPSGLHLVSIDMIESATAGGRARCDAFAYERGNIIGGQKLGEVLVFTNRLDAAKRQELEQMLMAKWGLAGCSGHLRTFTTGSVASGVTAAFPYQRLSFTDKLTIGGTVKANDVSAAKLEITDEAAAVEGTLTLSSGGEMTVSVANPRRFSQQTVRLLAAQSVVGDVSGWTVKSDYTGTIKLSKGSDGLYGTFNPRGLVILFW